MRNILLLVVAAVVVVVLLPGLMSGGSEGAKDRGSSAADSLTDKVKDPAAVGDAAGKIVDPAVEVVTPWWEALYAQPWFWTGAIAVAAMIALVSWWRSMTPRGRQIVVGVAVFAFMFTVIAISQ